MKPRRVIFEGIHSMQEYKVYVVEFGDRPTYQLQWIDPNTGRKRTKTSGVKRTGRKKERDDAAKAAGKLQESLMEGSHVSGNVSWEAFRTRYENEVARQLATTTAIKVSSVFNLVEEFLSPSRLSQLTAERISYFQSRLREGYRSESGIKSTLAHLKAALRWAERMKLLAKAPPIDMPGTKADKMRGRPLAAEEYERILEAVPKVVKNEAKVKQWLRFLRGLWLSGLRLSEALRLSWDDDLTIRVDFTGRRPMLHIPAGQDKSKKARRLPITPDFAAMLEETPLAERKGRVFQSEYSSRSQVGRRVSAFGEKALVKVGERTRLNKEGKPEIVPGFAGCHDYRRSFGERWASRVMPQVLMELMRHESMSTTQTFYVGKNAERTADAVWNAFESMKGNTLGNTAETTANAPKTAESQTIENKELK